MVKKLLISVLSFVLFAGVAKPVLAVTVPNFGSCTTPQVAASQVNYGSNHGVVGQSTSYSGVDTIYTLSDGNVMQCLCPDKGTGIQTNWLKTTNFSQTDINILVKEGWKYIATGSSWGLEDVPYLAKNTNYSCHNESVLAATGSAVAIYGLILAGITSLIAGLLLKRFSK